MSWRAVRTLMGEPSASSTAAYLEKTAMPGPMMACERSTGATGESLVAGPFGHLVERLGQHGVQLADELAAGNGGCVSGALAADENDAGSEGIR